MLCFHIFKNNHSEFRGAYSVVNKSEMLKCIANVFLNLNAVYPETVFMFKNDISHNIF